MSQGSSPAGWYDDPGGSGRQRWWGGRSWTHHQEPAIGHPPAPEAVLVNCLHCGSGLQLRPEQDGYVCPVCNTTIVIFDCEHCGCVRVAALQSANAHFVECGGCKKTCYQRTRHCAPARRLRPTDRLPPGQEHDPDQRVVAGAVNLCSGIGGLVPGGLCILRFGMGFVGMRYVANAAGPTPEYAIPYAEVDALDVSGRGTTVRSSNVGLIGGGFGVRGAMEGIAIASVVNALTTTTAVDRDTWLRFKAGPREIVMLTSRFEPAELRVILAPTFARITAAHKQPVAMGSSTSAGSSGASIETRLAELVRLRDAGVISESEYTEQRQRVLAHW